MKRRPDPPPVDLALWDTLPEHQRTLRVLEWLGDDERRADLYQAMRGRGGRLWVPSAARCDKDGVHAPVGAEVRHAVLLLCDADAVAAALRDGERFSNVPYERLGSGDFLLGLDPKDGDAAAHAAQAAALHAAFRAVSLPDVQRAARWSARAAVTALLGGEVFDAAALAEHAALRFVQVLYGYAGADVPLLEASLRAAYRAMTVQMLGRHFVVEPGALIAGKGGLAGLARRSAELMREFALDRPGWPDGLERPGDGIPELVPVLASLARGAKDLNVADLAVVVAGSLAGTVGNVQASACIALKALLGGPADALQRAVDAAMQAGRDGEQARALWAEAIAPALRANPPAPFLPRRLRVAVPEWDAREGDDVVLCVGGGSTQLGAPTADALVFGLDAAPDRGLHWCIGALLAREAVSAIVGEVLRLPGLAERLDDHDGRAVGLSKRWGFACESYPLRHRRDLRIVQQPLNVHMRVRWPIEQHGAALRAIIRNGAARIERVLRESRHVHFAWFEFIEDGHVLVLHTVFDGEFEAYLQHFAVAADALFDELFEHVDPGLARPVREAPEDFVRLVLAHHKPAAGGFFFSAYPQDDTARVHLALGRLP